MWAGRPTKERQAAICQQYARLFQDEAALDCVEYLENDWNQEQFAAGCYVGIMAPQVMTTLGPLMGQPCGVLHFAGTEFASRWAGYMDGAVESGERAAVHMLTELGGLSSVEAAKVLSRKEDQEIPTRDMVCANFLSGPSSFVNFCLLTLLCSAQALWSEVCCRAQLQYWPLWRWAWYWY